MSSYFTNVVNAIRGKKAPVTLNEGAKAQVTSHGHVGWHLIDRSHISNADVFSEFDAAQLAEIYSKSALVYACVREKATSIAEAPIEIGRINDEEEFEAEEDNEMLDLFYSNPNFSYTQIMRLLVERLELTGANWIITNDFENRTGIGELTPVPTHLLQIETKGVRIIRYKMINQNLNGGEKFFKPEEVCPHMYLDPTKLNSFQSPLEPALREQGIDDERINLTMELLKNRKIPGLILVGGGNKSQRDEIKASVEESLGQITGSRADTLLVPPGIEVREGKGQEDIDFTALNSLTETRICMAFQVPPIVIGAQAGLNTGKYSNYKEARKSYMSETILNLWDFIADGFTRSLLRVRGERDLVFQFNTSKIKELQADLNEVSKRSQELFKEQVITREESRTMLDIGLEELPEEDRGFKVNPVPVAPVDDEDENDDSVDNSNEDNSEKNFGKVPRLKPLSGASRSQAS